MEESFGKFKNKEKVIVDTCILVKYIRGDLFVRKELDILFELGKIFITPIVYTEIMNGTNKRSLKSIKELLSKIPLIFFDEYTAFNLVKLSNSNSSNGYLTAIDDSLIGLTSVQNGFKLYTDNKKDFMNIPGIKFYQTKTYSQKNSY